MGGGRPCGGEDAGDQILLIVESTSSVNTSAISMPLQNLNPPAAIIPTSTGVSPVTISAGGVAAPVPTASLDKPLASINLAPATPKSVPAGLCGGAVSVASPKPLLSNREKVVNRHFVTKEEMQSGLEEYTSLLDSSLRDCVFETRDSLRSENVSIYFRKDELGPALSSYEDSMCKKISEAESRMDAKVSALDSGLVTRLSALEARFGELDDVKRRLDALEEKFSIFVSDYELACANIYQEVANVGATADGVKSYASTQCDEIRALVSTQKNTTDAIKNDFDAFRGDSGLDVAAVVGRIESLETQYTGMVAFRDSFEKRLHGLETNTGVESIASAGPGGIVSPASAGGLSSAAAVSTSSGGASAAAGPVLTPAASVSSGGASAAAGPVLAPAASVSSGGASAAAGPVLAAVVSTSSGGASAAATSTSPVLAAADSAAGSVSGSSCGGTPYPSPRPLVPGGGSAESGAAAGGSGTPSEIVPEVSGLVVSDAGECSDFDPEDYATTGGVSTGSSSLTDDDRFLSLRLTSQILGKMDTDVCEKYVQFMTTQYKEMTGKEIKREELEPMMMNMIINSAPKKQYNRFSAATHRDVMEPYMLAQGGNSFSKAVKEISRKVATDNEDDLKDYWATNFDCLVKYALCFKDYHVLVDFRAGAEKAARDLAP